MSALESALGREQQLWEVILSTVSVAKIEIDRNQERGKRGKCSPRARQALSKNNYLDTVLLRIQLCYVGQKQPKTFERLNPDLKSDLQ